MAEYQTGYYILDISSISVVHVIRNGKTVCGAHYRRLAQLHIIADGIVFDKIECRTCKNWVRHEAPLIAMEGLK